VGSNIIIPYLGFEWRKLCENLSPLIGTTTIVIHGIKGFGVAIERVAISPGTRSRHLLFFDVWKVVDSKQRIQRISSCTVASIDRVREAEEKRDLIGSSEVLYLQD